MRESAPAETRPLPYSIRRCRHSQNTLEVYTKADPPSWADVHSANIEEADFAAAHFDSCIQMSGILTNDTPISTDLPVRDALKLACQWGARDMGEMPATEKALLSEGP